MNYEVIKNEIIKKSQEYKENSKDQYDFWEEHIKFVYEESVKLAKLYGADVEIVTLGALLHDIALIYKVGEKKDHHENGKMLADKILDEISYPKERKERVLGCIYNHRNSKNTTNIEELCVADADILAHFRNIPMLFNMAFAMGSVTLNEVRQWIKKAFLKDYSELSDRTKETFTDEYNQIIKVVLGL